MGETVSGSQAASQPVLWLGDAASGDPRSVGGKAAQLSRLHGVCEVPDAFCVTTDAYAAYEAAGSMPPEVASAIVAAYEELAARSDVQPGSGVSAPLAVAVRSSAADEDGAAASFAGQHETQLNVRGSDDLLKAVESVWRSAHSESAHAYRRELGLDTVPVAVAVLVQRLVRCDASGVAFTVDPVSSDDDKIVISASWGLGESLVGGTINPDRWVLDKQSLSVLQRTIGDKDLMTVTQERGTREVKTPSFLRQSASLADDQVRSVATIAKDLETRLRHAVDVEFAVVDGRPVLLQCRPVTTIGTGTEAGGVDR